MLALRSFTAYGRYCHPRAAPIGTQHPPYLLCNSIVEQQHQARMVSGSLRGRLFWAEREATAHITLSWRLVLHPQKLRIA